MARILLSIVLGLFTLVVFIGLGESLQGRGAVAVIVAGLAIVLYLALAEFLVAPRGRRGLHGKWPTIIAMGGPLLAICLITIVAEGGRQWLSALLMSVAGCLGILAGAAVAGLVTFRAMSPESCRRFLLASAAVLIAVAIVLIVRVIPLTESAGTFPDGTPGGSVPVFWGMVGLNALVAACLVFFGFRVGDDNRPPSGALALLAFLAFMSACTLAILAFAFRGHGPMLLTVSKLALLCMVTEIVVTGLVGSTALRLSEARGGLIASSTNASGAPAA